MHGPHSLTGPVQPATSAGGSPSRILRGTVVTVNANGTVDIKPHHGRAAKLGVPAIAHYEPTIGDVVVYTDVNGDPNMPAILEVLTAAKSAPDVAALAARVKSFNLTNAASLDLGAIDGENITGVRITGNGVFKMNSGAGGLIRLRPNGLASANVQSAHQRLGWTGSAVYADNALYTGGAVNVDGFAIWVTDWVSGVNALNQGSFEGTFFTRHHGSNVYRDYLGTYSNRDFTTNDARHVFGSMKGTWLNGTTPLTSVVLAMSAGTFTGRIAMEIIP